MLLSSISDLYSEAEIAEMQAWLDEHPIDHKYDDICDSLYDGRDTAVLQQSLSRSYYATLKRLRLRDNFIEGPKDDQK